jgi:hypothetical protein
MNERIQKLAVEAEVWANQFEEHWADGPDTYQLFKEKFAELIIKEALGDLKERIALRYQGSEKDHDIAYGMEIVYFDIVDKFGVK